jgi:parallel beta-helix repeat protein
MRHLDQHNGVSNIIINKGKKLLATTAMTAVSLLPLSNQAKAIDANTTPTGGNAIFGGIDIQQSGTRTDITQIKQTGLIHWDSFDHGSNAVTEFHQPNSSAWTFNRVVGNIGTAKRTIIDGDITANGNIGILDDNGVLIGEFGSIDAAGVLLSTGQISNYDTSVEAGQFVITDLGDGKITNNGTITVAEAGVAAFVAPTVVNNGVINARLSNVVMAAGDTVTLDMYGDGLVEVAVDGELADGIIKQNGTVNAQGGNVLISAAIAKDAVDNVINMTGTTNASSAEVKGGKIVLSGGSSGRVRVAGDVRANGNSGQDAGSIEISGENVLVTNNGDIRARSIFNGTGNAGDIIVTADDTLTINGELSALGLADTGFIETSAPNTNFGANASVLATREWLLDPTDITIDNALAILLEGQLAVGDMTVMTPDVGLDNGNIGVTTIVDWATDNTFKLVAHNDVFLSSIGGGINATGAGNFVVEAGDDFRMNTGNNSINTNGGNVTITTADEVTIDDGVINANGGNILIDNAEQFEAVADSLQTSGTGTITLNQNKDANGNTTTTDATIQNAIDAISNTGAGENTVHVGAGTWVEAVNIDKAVSVEGAGRNDTIVTPGATNNGFTIDGTIDGKVEIKKLAVDGGLTGVRVNSTADVKRLIVANAILRNNGFNGVGVYGDSVGKTTIKNSIFLDNGLGGSVGTGGDGDILFFLHNGDIELKNIDIQGNDIINAADYGIQIRGANVSAPAGEINIDNVKIAGDYRAALLGIQEFSAIDNLSMTDVTLGGQTDAGTDSAGWASLFLSNLGSSDIDLGNTTFEAVNGQYITLGTNGTTYFTTNNIDATDATFEGIAAADLTIEESFDVEDKIIHKIDFAPQGLVTWQEGNVFVTSASNGFGGGIQRGIDAVTEGGTVNVDDSTYTEDLIIDKSLKLTGHGTTLQSSGADNLITVTASDVNIDPFTFDGLGIADYGVNATGLGAIGLTVDGNTFKNFNEAGVFVAANGVGTGTIINNAFEGSSKRGVRTGDLDGGYVLNITDNTIGSNGDEVQNAITFGRLRNATLNVSGGSMDTSGDAISGGNVGSNVEIHLTNLDIEAGDEVADFNGNLSGLVSISGGTLIGAGSGFETNFIGSNGTLEVKDGAVLEGTHTSQGYGINILRNRVEGAINVTDSTVKGGNTGIGSAGGLMHVNGSVEVTNSTVQGLNGDGIEIGDVAGSVLVQTSDVEGADDGIDVSGDVTDGASITITGNTRVEGLGSVSGDDGLGDGIAFGGAISGASTIINILDNDLIRGNDRGINFRSAGTGGPSTITDASLTIAENDEIRGTILDGILFNADITNANITIGGASTDDANGLIIGGQDGIDIQNVDGGTFTISHNTKIEGLNGDGIEFEGAVNNAAVVTVSENEDIIGTDNGINFEGNITNATVNILNNNNGIFAANGNGLSLAQNLNAADINITGNIIEAGNNGVLIDGEFSNGTTINVDNNTKIAATNGSGVSVKDTTAGGATVSVSGNQDITAGSNGIEIEKINNAVVDDNDIDGATNGIHAKDSNDIMISNNEIDDASDKGIWVEDSNDAQIVSNEINDNGASTFANYGILVDGGNSVDVDDNKIEETSIAGIAANNTTYIDIDDNLVKDGKDGILVDGGHHADIRRNETRDMSDDGIQVKSHADVEIEDNNKVIRSADSGITVSGSARAEIDGNNVDDAENGIRVTNSANAKITNNEVDDADNSGIWVKNSNNADVANNFINDHGATTFVDYGILIEGGNSVDVDFNKVEEASVAGIAAKNTTYVNIDDNLVKDGGAGISVEGGTNADIRRNQVFDMEGNGIETADHDNIDVEENIVERVAENGIEVFGTNAANIRGNRIKAAGNDGINVENADVSLIYQNRIRRTGDDGIEVRDGEATAIFDNMIRRAGYVEGGDNADEGGADAIHVTNVGPADFDEGLLGLGAAIFSNDIDKTYDDGIEVVDSGTTLIINNILTDIGIRNGRSREGADFFGADAIHLRNVRQGTLGFGDFEGLELDFEDIFTITTPRQADPQTATVDVDFFPEGNPFNFGSYVLFNEINGTADDGIEVISDQLSISRRPIFENTSTLIGFNDIQHVGYGVPTGDGDGGDGDGGSDYGYAEDGYGADAIHARGLTNFGFGLADGDGSPGDGDGFTGDGSPIGDGFPLTTAESTTIYPIYSDPMAVEVIENYIWTVGDDGVEVRDSGRTNVSGNEIRNVGLATNDTEAPIWTSGWDFGANDGDGIHIKNVYGALLASSDNSVEIKGNIIDHTGDDGVEVHQSGRTLIEDNNISNAGIGDGHSYGGGDEGYGHDGIHVGGVFDDYSVNEGDVNSVTIRNNVIDVTGDDGVEVHWSGRTSITDNEISNVGYGESGPYEGDEDGADAINVMHVTSNDNNLPFSVDIRRNTIDVTADDGIEVAHSSRTLIRNNDLTNIGSGGGKDYEGGDIYGADGIHVRNIKQTSERPNRADVRIINNNIFDAADNGIESLDTRQVVVKRNTVDTTGDDGIRIINGGLFSDLATAQSVVRISSPHYEDLGISRAVIEQNTVSNAGTPFPEEGDSLTTFRSIRRPGGDGIEVGGFERIFVRNENVVTNSVESGLNVSGGFNGDVEVSGNTFTDNDIGASFESGNIDLTGDGNVFDGGRVGMRFAPAIIGFESPESDVSPTVEQTEFVPLLLLGDPIFADMSLVDNTIGAQTFGGQEGNYVGLDNEAFFAPGSPTLLNALDSTYLDTPFGAVTPSVDFASGFTAEQLAYFESKFLHFNDNGNTGLFFFPLLPEIDQEDILRYFGPNANALSGLNVTILGLPGIPGGAPVALNNITPAAGGEFDPNDPASLNAIETAAGGEEAGCWGDATSKASSGPVSLSYGGSAEDLLNSEASCGS